MRFRQRFAERQVQIYNNALVVDVSSVLVTEWRTIVGGPSEMTVSMRTVNCQTVFTVSKRLPTCCVAILSEDIPWPPDYEPQGLLTPPLAKGGIASLKLADLPPDNSPPDKVEEIRARLAEYCAFVGYACRSSGCEFVGHKATGLLQDTGAFDDTGQVIDFTQ